MFKSKSNNFGSIASVIYAKLYISLALFPFQLFNCQIALKYAQIYARWRLPSIVFSSSAVKKDKSNEFRQFKLKIAHFLLPSAGFSLKSHFSHFDFHFLISDFDRYALKMSLCELWTVELSSRTKSSTVSRSSSYQVQVLAAKKNLNSFINSFSNRKLIKINCPLISLFMEMER